MVRAFGHSIVSIDNAHSKGTLMNIYVGNLSYDMTEGELQQLFEEYGSVVSVNLIKDRDTGNLKGFGFVEMEDQSQGQTYVIDLK